MSLKSFDKFCEKMIMGEPVARQKALYDERQNQVRTRLIIEALLIGMGAAALNTLLMDADLRWCESYITPMFLIAAIVYLYFIIKCTAKGVLFGVNGTKPQRYTAGTIIGMGTVYLLMFILTDERRLFTEEGWLSDDVVFVAAYAIYIICGIMLMVLAHKFDKAKKADENNDER